MLRALQQASQHANTVCTATALGLAMILGATHAVAQLKPTTAIAKAPTAMTAAPVSAVRRAPRGPVEKYDCKIGSEDEHARIAVLAQGGEVQSVAYYSKWKPRTCSVHLQRGDAYSRWNDTGDATTVTTEYGDFLIQSSRSEYQLFFREVDRMHYCGMMGKLNGSMTVTRSPKSQCSVVGVMDRNETEALDTHAAANTAPLAASGATSPEVKVSTTD